ncbi:MAG: glycoside hydrolase family 130 protein [Chryseolinea sp.]
MKQNATSLKQFLVIGLCALFATCNNKPNKQEIEVRNDSSWAIMPFIKTDSINPVLVAGINTFNCPVLKKTIAWNEKDVFNPAAVVRGDKVYMIFRAEDKIGKYAGTSRIGLAESTDGLHFTMMKEPVLYPDEDSLKRYEWEGGVEDPRVIESDEGKYIMTYTAYDGTTARLLLAVSDDLFHWSKYGTVLNGKYKNAWSKSGAIVCERKGSRIVATKINGKFWMYFGDTDLFIATSEDLIHWTPVEENGELKSVLKPRPGYFDSRLVESGPYALLMPGGINLIYNGMNLDHGGDSTLAKGAYCAGQALFSKEDPSMLINRLEKNFLQPNKPYEIEGQVNQVCFVEGMVPFKGNWLLYYGTADSRIAAAVCKQ